MSRQPTGYVRRFAGETHGYVTIEALIALPILLTLFASTWVFFDAFRQQSISQKANYTIGDMISRETLEIDDEYINNVQRLFYFLTRTGGGNDSDIRISLVRYDSRSNQYFIDWSEARGDPRALNTGLLRRQYQERLPVMAHADTVILVETWDRYNPVFTFENGLTAFDITTFSFTRPRYSPQIVREDTDNNANWDPRRYEPNIPENEREGQWADNGFGTDGGEAPGNSLCNNNAANQTDCTNSDGSTNTGGGDTGGGGSTADVPVPPTTTGGSTPPGGTSPSSGGSDNSSSGSSSNENGGGSTYTPPPPPPPPPPAPPMGSR